MKKKVLLIILSVIIIAGVTVGCFYVYKHFTKTEDVELNKDNSDTSKIEIDKTQIGRASWRERVSG